jgi:hypothetical protein
VSDQELNDSKPIPVVKVWGSREEEEAARKLEERRGCFWVVFLGFAFFLSMMSSPMVLHDDDVDREFEALRLATTMAKTRTDLRQLRSAIEAYAADHGGAHPPMAWNSLRGDTAKWLDQYDVRYRPLFGTLIHELPRDANGVPDPRGQWGSITTPVAYYVGRAPGDWFQYDGSAARELGDDLDGRYAYWNLAEYRAMLESGRVAPSEGAIPPRPDLSRLPEFESAFGDYVLLSLGPHTIFSLHRSRRSLFQRFDPSLGPDSSGTIYVSQKGASARSGSSEGGRRRDESARRPRYGSDSRGEGVGRGGAGAVNGPFSRGWIGGAAYALRVAIGVLVFLVVTMTILSWAGERSYREYRRTKDAVRWARSELSSMRVMIESYAIDHGAYPRMTWRSARGDAALARLDGAPARSSPPDSPLFATFVWELPRDAAGEPVAEWAWGSMSTPVAYYSGGPMLDPFGSRGRSRLGFPGDPLAGRYLYFNLADYRALLDAGQVHPSASRLPPRPRREQLLAYESAFGAYVVVSAGPLGWSSFLASGDSLFVSYDPTNGTKSAGRVFASARWSEHRWVDAEALER